MSLFPRTIVKNELRVPGVAWVLLIAAALWAVYGSGYLGYDGFFALVWGNDMAHGRLPDYVSSIAPTPHPLANFAGLLLTPFGVDAPAIFQIVILLSLAALVWGAFRLGSELFSWPVGAIFAAILATRPILIGETLYGAVDIPFMALVVWAMVLEARQRRRGVAVLVLLALAGLLRPEAWLLSGAYTIYLFYRRPVWKPLRFVALAAAAPLAWLGSDLIITGDALHSLHGTRDLAAQLLRKRTAGAALGAAGPYLRRILGEPVLWAGLAGAVFAAARFRRRALLPIAVIFFGLFTFVLFGALGLPVLTRYLLLPGAMFALFCAVALAGWQGLPSTSRMRIPWLLAAVVLGALFVTSIPDQRRAIDSTLAWVRPGRDSQRDLRRLVSTPLVRSTYSHCTPVHVPNRRFVPSLAYWLDRNPNSIVPAQDASLRGGLVVGPVVPAVVRDLLVRSMAGLNGRKAVGAATPRFRALSANDSWNLYEHCGQPSRRPLLALWPHSITGEGRWGTYWQ